MHHELAPHAVPSPLEEAIEALCVAKLVDAATGLEAEADAFIVGVRVDFVCRRACRKEARAIDVHALA